VSISPPPSTRNSAIELGYVAGAHGIHGELKIKLYNPESSFFHNNSQVILRSKAGKEHALTVRSLRATGKLFILGFKEVRTREFADELRSATVLMIPDTRDLEEESEVYLESLRGYRVVDVEHGDLGILHAFMLTSLDILVVRGENGKEHLLPVHDHTIHSVDSEKKVVVLETPEGLLEG
jgi:16S rRNA processing protein RimM